MIDNQKRLSGLSRKNLQKFLRFVRAVRNACAGATRARNATVIKARFHMCELSSHTQASLA